jgi:hypothetical protein
VQRINAYLLRHKKSLTELVHSIIDELAFCHMQQAMLEGRKGPFDLHSGT